VPCQALLGVGWRGSGVVSHKAAWNGNVRVFEFGRLSLLPDVIIAGLKAWAGPDHCSCCHHSCSSLRALCHVFILNPHSDTVQLPVCECMSARDSGESATTDLRDKIVGAGENLPGKCTQYFIQVASRSFALTGRYGGIVDRQPIPAFGSNLEPFGLAADSFRESACHTQNDFYYRRSAHCQLIGIESPWRFAVGCFGSAQNRAAGYTVQFHTTGGQLNASP
jgi:hypothetical protein